MPVRDDWIATIGLGLRTIEAGTGYINQTELP